MGAGAGTCPMNADYPVIRCVPMHADWGQCANACAWRKAGRVLLRVARASPRVAHAWARVTRAPPAVKTALPSTGDPLLRPVDARLGVGDAPLNAEDARLLDATRGSHGSCPRPSHGRPWPSRGAMVPDERDPPESEKKPA